MNMSCANPDCKAELKYLRGGRLFLMEKRPKVPHLASYDPPGSTRPVMMRRYFWLCESCAKTYSIRRWTDDGVEIIPLHGVKRPVPAMRSRDWTVPGLVG